MTGKTFRLTILLTIILLSISCRSTVQLATDKVVNECKPELIQIPSDMRFQGESDVVIRNGYAYVKIDRYTAAVVHARNLMQCAQSLDYESKALRRELRCSNWQLNSMLSSFIVIPAFHKMQSCPFPEVERPKD